MHFGGALPAVREVIDEPLTAGFEALLNAAYGCLADAFLPLLHAAFDLDLACLLDPIMEPSNLPTLEEPCATTCWIAIPHGWRTCFCCAQPGARLAPDP